MTKQSNELEGVRQLRVDRRWTVMSCPYKSTLRVVDALTLGGVKAWTPRHWVNRRLPRSKKRVDELRPLIPGLWFLGGGKTYEQVRELITRPPKAEPLRDITNAPLMVSTGELMALQQFDDPDGTARHKPTPWHPKVGEEVRAHVEFMANPIGKVLRISGDEVTVDFGPDCAFFRELKINRLLLTSS